MFGQDKAQRSLDDKAKLKCAALVRPALVIVRAGNDAPAPVVPLALRATSHCVAPSKRGTLTHHSVSSPGIPNLQRNGTIVDVVAVEPGSLSNALEPCLG